MNIEELLNSYPLKRIKPSDGLAITAEVWEEAHEYHRHNHRYHTMLGHGPGILSGLEVIASDPPDTSIYISPGVAIDAKLAVAAVVTTVVETVVAIAENFLLVRNSSVSNSSSTGSESKPL